MRFGIWRGILGTVLFFPMATTPASPSPGFGRAIDKLRKAANFEPIRQCITLSDGSDFEYWVKPLTAAERERAQKNGKSTNDFAMQLLVMKAEDENGEKIFKSGDIPVLRNDIEDEILQKMILSVLKPNGEEGEEPEMKSADD